MSFNVARIARRTKQERQIILIIQEETPQGTAFFETRYAPELFKDAEPHTLGGFLKSEVGEMHKRLDAHIAKGRPEEK